MSKYPNMNNFDYFKICQELTQGLTEREKETIWRRFGFKNKERETLESIGKDWGITRERVRQIENSALAKIKPKTSKFEKVFQFFISQFKKSGNLKKEDVLLYQLGKENYQNEVFFLLSLREPFKRFFQTKEFYSLWTTDLESLTLAKKIINNVVNKLKETNRLLSFKEIQSLINPSLSFQVLSSYLEISKIIKRNEEGFFGLSNWPEISPRGVKDKAYLVFKKVKKPLHFTEIAQLIGPNTLPQTVHNEVIKDPRFVLVGRGIYALKEWGYEEGDVKDIIIKILREAQKPLPKKVILEEVFKQRLVKESTVLLNLNNKKYFLKTPQGEYKIKET